MMNNTIKQEATAILIYGVILAIIAYFTQPLTAQYLIAYVAAYIPMMYFFDWLFLKMFGTPKELATRLWPDGTVTNDDKAVDANARYAELMEEREDINYVDNLPDDHELSKVRGVLSMAYNADDIRTMQDDFWALARVSRLKAKATAAEDARKALEALKASQ